MTDPHPTVIDRFQDEFQFLSNFASMSTTTLEHEFQARKTLDPAWQERIMGASTPGQAKRLGRKAPLRPDWDDIRLDVMLDLLRVKFSIPEFHTRLIATGDAELIEGNHWHDQFWGNCTCGRPKCKPTGTNHLGRLLMQVRNELLDT